MSVPQAPKRNLSFSDMSVYLSRECSTGPPFHGRGRSSKTGERSSYMVVEKETGAKVRGGGGTPNKIIAAYLEHLRQGTERSDRG